jgi:hypothetical protein
MAKVVAALPGVYLSSEPWGLAPAVGYQLGRCPPASANGTALARHRAPGVNRYGAARQGRYTRRHRQPPPARPTSSTTLGTVAASHKYTVNFISVHGNYTLKDFS